MINFFYIFPRKLIKYALFNGSFYYIFEYFLYLYLKKVNVNLYMICHENIKKDTERRLREYFPTRYNTEFPKTNIYYITQYELYTLKNRFKNSSIIIDTETFKNVFIQSVLNKTNQIYLIYTARFKETINTCNDILSKLNIFHCIENVNYNKKIYFNILKKPKQIKNKNYINLKEFRSVSVNQYLSIIQPVLKKLKNTTTIIMIDMFSSLADFLNRDANIELHYEAIPKLFEMFDTYIDCALNTFDYSPRMLLESFYLHKKVYYINNNKKDNAEFRYNDILSNNIEKYFLNDDDFIIKSCLKNV